MKHPDGLPFNEEDLRNPDDVDGVRQYLESFPKHRMDWLLCDEPLADPEEARGQATLPRHAPRKKSAATGG
jgi:hypothetical protein